MGQLSEFTKQANILVVDDVPENLQVLSGILKKKGYKVRPVPNGKLALTAAMSDPPDLILLDINMPDMDGYEVCRVLKANEPLRSIPVIFISAYSDITNKVKAFKLGGEDYVSKPFQIEEVLARVETHLKLRNLMVNLENVVQEQVKIISESQMATIFALAKLAESRDDTTGKHIDRVQVLSKTIAGHLVGHPKFPILNNYRNIELIEKASPLHDIGKVGIPENILLKPGKLTVEEFNEMKKHTIIGADTLSAILEKYPGNDFIRTGIDITRFHHEQWDGKGYPDGLSGTDIPVSARIVSIADVYDALRSKRPYKEGFPHEASITAIVDLRGQKFDPDMIDVLIDIAEEIEKVWESLKD